jgi:hypothetical protein
MTERLGWLNGMHGMRDGVLEQLVDADLAFSPGGTNPNLGRLIGDLLDIERSYLDSLRHGVQRWPSRVDDADDDVPSVRGLRALFTAVDRDMLAAAVAGVDTGATVVRPDGTTRTVDEQLEIYTQAAFVFLGKAVVYLNAMGRALPPSIAHYIA